MTKLLLLYVVIMALVGWAAIEFLITSTATVQHYKELCYEKHGRDHLKCAFVLPKEK